MQDEKNDLDRNVGLVKYKKLQRAVDALSNSNEIIRFNETFTILTNNIQKLEEIRNKIQFERKRKNDQIRIATDIRSFVSKKIIQSFVAPLGIVAVEL